MTRAPENACGNSSAPAGVTLNPAHGRRVWRLGDTHAFVTRDMDPVCHHSAIIHGR